MAQNTTFILDSLMRHVTRLKPQWRLHTSRRSGRADRHACFTTAPRSGAFELPPQPTASSEDGGRTIRTRQHTNKSLPLPPILDPVLTENREGHAAAKPTSLSEDEGLTDYQKALQGNPFAWALATPIRQCSITRVRLPSYFLIPFQSELPWLGAEPANGNTQPAVPRIVPAIFGVKSKATQSYALGTREAISSLAVQDGKRPRWPVLVNIYMERLYALLMEKQMHNVKPPKEWHCDTENLVQQVRDQLARDVKHCLAQCMRARTAGKDRVVASLSAEGESLPEDLACIVRIENEEFKGQAETHAHCFEYKVSEKDVGNLANSRKLKKRGIVLRKHVTATYAMTALERLRDFERTDEPGL
ncbi:Hypothetical predicted protein [Lecanosticta acicola]|uniref:Uncharacterized protein n=1 Tax=Lecanosticta acicola TaxID=111012 RepID=A0AAI8YX33_9PEZI|nr:Hypothetical predicted protein [Lecanosticta acicola]